MPLYYITGISGSGKSTALQELRHRGYKAYDVDEAGPVTAKWHNDTTGFVHSKSSIKKEDRTPEFLANHSWKVPRQEVIALVEQAGAKIVFLGGAITNEAELQDLFSTAFALTIDDDILKHRLTTRTNNDWGKNPHEFIQTLAMNRQLVERYRKRGDVIMDASQTTNTIVDEILSYLHVN